jgi:hypothetical protein
LFKTHITTPRHFEDPLRTREKKDCSAALQEQVAPSNPQKNCRQFLLILTEV